MHHWYVRISHLASGILILISKILRKSNARTCIQTLHRRLRSENFKPSQMSIPTKIRELTATSRFSSPVRRMQSISCLLLWLSLVSFCPAEPVLTSNRVFNIYHGKNSIGFLKITETRQGEKTQIDVRSEIEARLIFTYTATGAESYAYRNDTLISSNLFRKVNDRVRLKQKMVWSGNHYRVTGPDFHKILDVQNIRFNLTRLFLQEPEGITQVFSDRFGQWVPVNRTGAHEYEVVLPNHSRTIFSYQEGKCRSVISIGTFYKVRLIPQP